MPESLAAFFAMGGYGGYIWPCYLLGAVLMVAVLALSLKAARDRENELEILQGNRQDRARRRAALAETASQGEVPQ